MNGKINKLTDRGYGFITPEGEDRDVFFHANALVDAEFNSLREGDAVTFEVEDGPKGPNAVNVVVSGDGGADEAPADDGDDMDMEEMEE